MVWSWNIFQNNINMQQVQYLITMHNITWYLTSIWVSWSKSFRNYSTKATDIHYLFITAYIYCIKGIFTCKVWQHNQLAKCKLMDSEEIIAANDRIHMQIQLLNLKPEEVHMQYGCTNSIHIDMPADSALYS